MAPVNRNPVVKKPKAPKKEEDPEKEERKVVSGQLEKKIKKQENRRQKEQRGVVFIKHIPHGFFEEQMQNYFEQFGTVTRLRLARSKRTGGSKGYAFIEFEYPEIAQVVAETMDNYLMFKKLVKAAYIPPEKQIYNYFKTKVRRVTNKAGKTIYVSGKTSAIQRRVKKVNDWNQVAYQKRTQKQLNKINKLKEKYAHLGIDFSKIVVGPKVLTAEEAAAAATAVETKTKEKTAGSLKRSVSNDGNVSKKSAKKSKDNIGLADLLGSTINDDSGDEDYIAMGQSDSDDDIDEETSDEEAYGFEKEESDGEQSVAESDEDENEDADEEADTTQKAKAAKGNKKSKLSYGKSIKVPKVDRFEELVKRKPKTGGIQKLNLKAQKKTIKTSAKNPMVLAAAKEMAKKQTSLKPKPIGTKKAVSASVMTKSKVIKNKKRT